MTYCLAWKKNKTAYLLSDTAASCISEISCAENNTFGEIQGLYGKHYVSEEQLKIYKISPNCAIAFSGIISNALEVINTFYELYTSMPFEKILEIIKINYSTYDIELIVLFSNGENNNNIYLYKSGVFKQTEFAEIGNATEVGLLSDDAHGMISSLDLPNRDSHYYLAIITSAFQCYFLNNSTFSKGIGGIVTGIFLNNSIKFCRDLEYYIIDQDIHEGKSISVISRNNSFFSSSDYDGGIRYFVNNFKDNAIYEDLYNRKAISKSLNTKNAYYYIFYNINYNVLYFLDVNGKTHNVHFRRYIKREDGNVHYAYTFRHDFLDYFKEFDGSNERIPTVIEMQVRETEYISHDAFISACIDEDLDKFQKYQTMDFDFSVMKYSDYDSVNIALLKNNISNYHNQVLIDYSYFCKVLEEKIKLYEQYHDFDLEEMNLESLINVFTRQIVADSFEKYCFIVVLQENHSKIINSYDIINFFRKYPNVYFIESANYMHDFNGTIFELMKQYYINDNFFHLDKFIIMTDNAESMNLLYEITPEFNFSCMNPDILLIRNLNGLTNMDGRLRYIVSDYLLFSILGLSLEEVGELDTHVYNFD